jgi:hypothetical protein
MELALCFKRSDDFGVSISAWHRLRGHLEIRRSSHLTGDLLPLGAPMYLKAKVHNSNQKQVLAVHRVLMSQRLFAPYRL